MATPPYVYDDTTPSITYDSADITYDGDNIDYAVWAWAQQGV